MMQVMSPGALLRHNSNYRNTWMAQVVSEIGDYFNNVAVFALVMEKSGSGHGGDRRDAGAGDSGGAGGTGGRAYCSTGWTASGS